ncbi:MAG: hypothetical protein AUK35_09460 [Zetaproteobacteria bacterium CG2_30_46_52]|nr:MAG: hypothetical protein AUK35_09460 [Zetaproteobacteria bacterium CG2_30_46_52]
MDDLNRQPNKIGDVTKLGPYTITSRLGQGGMGIVYEAMDDNLGRKVAIKVLHPHLLRHENLKARFRREARRHAKLMHPNIVTLLSLYEDEEHMALVMEMVEGIDLKAYLKKNPQLSLEIKLNIALDILSGLEAPHQFGMVHRDLKPANVLVSNQGEVKLLDFGLAKPEEGEDDLTQSGATVGSFRYMSPEQILNQAIDSRTDLYAFGILLYFMLVGKLPFDATSNGGEFEIMEKQVREPAPTPCVENPDIPTEISDLILSLLEKNKNNRPRDAATVRSIIKNIRTNIRERRKHPKHENKQPVRTPGRAPSNAEVAQQWIHLAKRKLKTIFEPISPKLSKQNKHLAALALFFIMLGSAVITLMNKAEETALQTQAASIVPPHKAPSIKLEEQPTQHEVQSMAKSEAPIITPEPATTAPKKEVKPTPVKEAPKPASKPAVVSKPTLVAVAKPKQPPIIYAPDQTAHQVKRNDGSLVANNEKDEFSGASHIFFPELANKGFFTSFKKGESTISFETPVTLSKIIIQRASVGQLDFKHGYIYLEARDADSGEWVRLFEREDDDVDVAVTISNVSRKVKHISTIRLLFKTVEPITIGPIDLLL